MSCLSSPAGVSLPRRGRGAKKGRCSSGHEPGASSVVQKRLPSTATTPFPAQQPPQLRAQEVAIVWQRPLVAMMPHLENLSRQRSAGGGREAGGEPPSGVRIPTSPSPYTHRPVPQVLGKAVPNCCWEGVSQNGCPYNLRDWRAPSIFVRTS